MPDEYIFMVYFSAIAGWQYHPGSGHGEHKVLSLEESASEAFRMVEIHRSLFSDGGNHGMG